MASSPNRKIELSGLSTNQVVLIRSVLEGNFEFSSPAFFDIVPCFTTNFDLKISQQNIPKLIQHYTLILTSLSQVVCKGLAKEWVKVICPRKQALYPYKFNKKPDWWPRHIPHVEPDHLDKDNRLALLVSIMRNKNVDLVQLKKSIGLTSFGSKFVDSHNTVVVQHLLYELFYINLYERLFFQNTVNSNLIDDLPADQKDCILKSKAIYVKASYLSGDFLVNRSPKPGFLNTKIYSVSSVESIPRSVHAKGSGDVKRQKKNPVKQPLARCRRESSPIFKSEAFAKHLGNSVDSQSKHEDTQDDDDGEHHEVLDHDEDNINEEQEYEGDNNNDVICVKLEPSDEYGLISLDSSGDPEASSSAPSATSTQTTTKSAFLGEDEDTIKHALSILRRKLPLRLRKQILNYTKTRSKSSLYYDMTLVESDFYPSPEMDMDIDGDMDVDTSPPMALTTMTVGMLGHDLYTTPDSTVNQDSSECNEDYETVSSGSSSLDLASLSTFGSPCSMPDNDKVYDLHDELYP